MYGGKLKNPEKVLITGASGFIGGHLKKFLEAKCYDVRCVDKEKDLRIFENALESTKGIDTVYHLAADVGGIGYISDTKNSRSIVQNSLINYNIFEASRRNGVKKTFFPSSSCVYSKAGVQAESDIFPAECENVYGWEKLYGEIMAGSFPEIGIKIARFQNIYGVDSHYSDGREMAIVALCRKIRDADKEIEVWGDGTQFRNWVYVTDCCEAIYELTNSDVTEPINIGVDDPISISDLANSLIKISGKDLSIKFIDGPLGPAKKTSDNTLRKKVLNWQPKVGIQEGLTETYEWVRTLL